MFVKYCYGQNVLSYNNLLMILGLNVWAEICQDKMSVLPKLQIHCKIHSTDDSKRKLCEHLSVVHSILIDEPNGNFRCKLTMK